jgi:hypothetical protein
VDAFDSVELDVAGGGWAADEGEWALGSSRWRPSGRIWTTSVTRTTHTWVSGMRVMARRPHRSLPSRTMVPVSAIVTTDPVTTAGMRSRLLASSDSLSTIAWASQGSPLPWCARRRDCLSDLAVAKASTTARSKAAVRCPRRCCLCLRRRGWSLSCDVRLGDARSRRSGARAAESVSRAHRHPAVDLQRRSWTRFRTTESRF